MARPSITIMPAQWTTGALREAYHVTDVAYAAAEARRSAGMVQEIAQFLGGAVRLQAQEQLDFLVLREQERDVDRLSDSLRRIEQRWLEQDSARRSPIHDSDSVRRAARHRPIPFPPLDEQPAPLVRLALLRQGWKGWRVYRRDRAHLCAQLAHVKVRRGFRRWSAVAVRRSLRAVAVRALQLAFFARVGCAMRTWIEFYVGLCRTKARVVLKWRRDSLYMGWQRLQAARRSATAHHALRHTACAWQTRRWLGAWHAQAATRGIWTMQLEACVRSWRELGVRRGFNNWVGLVRQWVRIRGMAARWRSPARHYAFKRWQWIAHERSRVRALLQRTGAALLLMWERRAMHTWRECAVGVGDAIAQLKCVAAAMRKRFHRRAFNQWSWAVEEEQRRWRVVRSAVALWLSFGLHNSLITWRAQCEEMALMRRVVLSWVGMTLRRALEAWRFRGEQQRSLRGRAVALLKSWLCRELRWALSEWSAAATESSSRLALAERVAGSWRSQELLWALSEWSAAAAHRAAQLVLAKHVMTSWCCQSHRRAFNRWAAGVEHAAAAAALEAHARAHARRVALHRWRAFAEASGRRREQQEGCERTVAALGLRRWRSRVLLMLMLQRADEAHYSTLARRGVRQAWVCWLWSACFAARHMRLTRQAAVLREGRMWSALDHAILRWRAWATIREKHRGRLLACLANGGTNAALAALWRWRRLTARQSTGRNVMRRALAVYASHSKALVLRRLMRWWRLVSAMATLRLWLGWRQWTSRLQRAHRERRGFLQREQELGLRRSKRRAVIQRRVLERWRGQLRAHRRWCALLDQAGKALRCRRRHRSVRQWARVAVACRRHRWELDCCADANWEAVSLRGGWRGWRGWVSRTRQFAHGAATAANLPLRRLLWWWALGVASRRAASVRTQTAYRRRRCSGSRMAISRWRRMACAARRPLAAIELAEVFQARNARRALRRWSTAVLGEMREVQYERLLHAHTVISSLTDEVREAEAQATLTGVEVDCLRSECAGLRRALDCYVPSHRRATVASRGWAVSLGATAASPALERLPKATGQSGQSGQSGHAGCTELIRSHCSAAHARLHSHTAPPHSPTHQVPLHSLAYDERPQSFRTPAERTAPRRQHVNELRWTAPSPSFSGVHAPISSMGMRSASAARNHSVHGVSHHAMPYSSSGRP